MSDDNNFEPAFALEMTEEEFVELHAVHELMTSWETVYGDGPQSVSLRIYCRKCKAHILTAAFPY